MEPTPTQPNSGYTGSTSPSHSNSSHATTGGSDSQFSTTAAHATGTGKYPTDATIANSQPSASGVQAKLNDAVASGKKWLNDSGLSDKAQQLPQSAKELGNKALNSVSSLTTTQKAVGVGLLAAGVAFLVTRGSKHKHKKHHDEDGEYRHKARRSPFDHQPHTKDGDHAYDRKGQRPWGASRYGAGPGPQGPGGRGRVSSGSGYSSGSSYGNDYSGRHSSDRSTSVGGSSYGSSYNSQSDSDSQHGSGQRRDQGPASGSRYDSQSSGGQNPNNLDQLNSAY